MTAADLLVGAGLRAEAAGGLAILLVLALRGPARRVIGAELAYGLWAIAPAAAVASVFPTFSEFMHGYEPHPHHGRPLPVDSWIVLLVWLTGVTAVAVAVAASEAQFHRRAREGRAGPAVMGVWWPRMITPADYDERFTASERQLIGAHERAHIARLDPRANLLIAVMQALSWFNPLVHLAARCARLDQELACDAAVVGALPGRRRDYAATLLKAHLAAPRSPFACAWAAAGRHPLELRLTMLRRPRLPLAAYMQGAVAVGAVATAAVLAVWIAGPQA